MSKHAPDHHDADLILKLYDLRREPVMRESRDSINSEYWPKNSIVHTNYLLENTGEGMFLFAKVEPYLEAMRASSHPRIFQNAQWISQTGEFADTVMNRFRTMIEQH